MTDGKNGLMTRVTISLLGIQTIILLAGIPWAFRVHGSVTAISATLATMPNQTEYTDLLQRVTVLETRAEG